MRLTGILGLHGRKVVASLKVEPFQATLEVSKCLHGRKVVASLKAVGLSSRQGRAGRLHGRKVVASLKGEGRDRGHTDRHLSPRPKGRGFVEGSKSWSPPCRDTRVSTAERSWLR